MLPEQTGANYDRLALCWQERHSGSRWGIAMLERAIRFVKMRGAALDVGCGSTGRFIDAMALHGFVPEGMDVSAEMIVHARRKNPGVEFYVGDVCKWELPRRYDLITAWDSTFHLPLAAQEPVTRKLCAGLNPGGVLLFTCGGGDPGEISGSFDGHSFEYSTLGETEFLRLLAECGCICRHLEYDQFPEGHVCVIAQKRGADGGAAV